MRYPIYRTICAFGIALLVAALVGCGATSTEGETQTPSAPLDSAAPDAGTEATAPTEYPPAPADVSGMRGWFEEAYPDAPWLARIKSIEYVKGEVPDSGGFSNAVVITTDLDFETEQAMGEEIAVAIGEAHPEWAKQYVVRFADGSNILAGEIFDFTP